MNFPVPNAQPPPYDTQRQQQQHQPPYDDSFSSAIAEKLGSPVKQQSFDDAASHSMPLSESSSSAHYMADDGALKGQGYDLHGGDISHNNNQDLYGASNPAIQQNNGYAPLQQHDRALYEDPFNPAWHAGQGDASRQPWDSRQSLDAPPHDAEQQGNNMEMRSMGKDGWDQSIGGMKDRSQPFVNNVPQRSMAEQVLFATGFDRLLRLCCIRKSMPLDEAIARKKRDIGGQDYAPAVWILTASKWRRVHTPQSH